MAKRKAAVRKTHPATGSKKKTTKKKTTKKINKKKSKKKSARKTAAATGQTPRKKRSSAKVSAAGKPLPTLTHDQISARAFEIWQRKGRPLGQDDQNWREAEAELLAGK